MRYRKYVGSTTAIFLGLATFAGGMNWLVDPYMMLGAPLIDEFNRIKPEINEHVRLSKSYQPTRSTWDVLLMGNSRVEMGLDPRHRCFSSAGDRVYNLGIPGASLRRQMEFALNIIYDTPPRELFFGIDFVDFLTLKTTSRPSRSSWTLPTGSLRYLFNGAANPEYRTNMLLDHYRSLFSLDALNASISTLLLQSTNQPTRDEYGFNPASDFANAVSLEGPNTLFAQKMDALDTKYDNSWALHFENGEPVPGFANLQRFLTIARNKGIRVTLFTNPFHEQFWSMLERNGLSALHREWMNMVTRLLATNAAPELQLWDFSSDRRFSTEPVPPPGVRSGPLDWFWEPSHYRRELGDLMLEDMLGVGCGESLHFGRLIRSPITTDKQSLR